MLSDCRECGKSFELPFRSGPKPQFCSHECRSTNRKRYYVGWVERNKEAVLEATRIRVHEWKKSNPDYFREHYKANKERRKRQSREWFAANKERALAKSKEYAAANPELRRAIGRKSRQTRRARLAAAFVEVVDAKVVFERDKGMCGICMKPIGSDKWHVDHITPLAQGGEHSYANSQLAHAKCNQSKGARV